MKKLLLSLFIGASSLAFGQNTLLDAYVEEGLKSNFALQQQNLEIEKSLNAIEIARSNIFPKIVFAPNYTLAAGGRRLDFPIGDLLNPVYNTLNKLTASESFPMVENQRIQFAPNNFHETKFTFQLPLFNSDIKSNIELQKKLALSQEAKKKLLEHEIRHQIKAAYYQYIQSTEALKIYDQALEFLTAYKAFNEKLVNNQMALKDQVLSASLEIKKMEDEQIEALKNRSLAAAYFNFLINRPFDSPIEIDPTAGESLLTDTDMAYFHETALESRPEFLQISSGLSANQSLLQLQEKNAKLPSFYLGGSTGFQGFGYHFNEQAFAVAQVGMQWDLFHGYEKKHKIQQTKIERLQLQSKEEELKQQVKIQVTKAFLELQAAENTLKKSEEMAEISQNLLELIEKKYKNQSALNIEVLKAQNDHLVAMQKLTLGKYQVLLKKSELIKTIGK